MPRGMPRRGDRAARPALCPASVRCIHFASAPPPSTATEARSAEGGSPNDQRTIRIAGAIFE